MRVSKMWKAIVGGIAAGTASVATAVQDGQITSLETVTIVIAILGGLGVTWVVPNQQPTKPTSGS